jgi:low affinity Fe/Cu permease
MADWFDRAAAKVSDVAGRWYAFLVAFGVVVVWAVTGPLFRFSETWQLVINTGTTIITFLMVFLIQNTQNRNELALQAKTDELIRAIEGADNRYRHIERAEHIEEQVRELERDADES